MRIRAKIDGQYVYGWYRYHPYYESHQLMVFITDEDRNCHGGGTWQEHEIDISLCAEDTGRKDKNGKPIFGSKGDMKGGDRVSVDGQGGKQVYFCSTGCWWEVDGVPLGKLGPDILAIIPQEKEGA